MNIALTKSRSTSCRNLVRDVCSENVVCDKNEIWNRYRLQRAKLETLSTEKTEQLNLEFVQQDLEKVASEIQTLRKAIDDLELSNSVVDCKTADVRELSDICKAKSSMSLDLSNLLQHQCNLRRQLELTRKALRNVKIDNVIISEELNRIGKNCWDEMSSQQDAHAQDRLNREQQTWKNAFVAREAAITSVANSITTHVLHKLQRPDSNNKRKVRTKSARERLDKYIQNAIIRERETAVVATTEYQLRRRRQVQNLLQLKRELDESKKSLAIKNEMKRSHDEDMASEKHHVKEILANEGANPYLAQYMLEIEEKHRELQRKMLAEEQKRLMEMQREYSIIEASKYKEEKERQKWDEHWAKMAKEKADQKKKEEHEKYYEVDTDTEIEFTKPTKDGKAKRSVAYSDFDQRSTKSRGRTSKARSEKSGKSERVSRPDTGLDQDDQRSEGTSGTGKKRKSKKERSRPAALSTRKAIHLEAEEKESLLNIADETTKTVLMDGGGNVFYFGDVNVGERKYVMVNVANIGTENVSLKMSPLNPYGPFTFCNSLKEIPPDNYYSLKYKFQPTESGESEEMIKIEEVGKRENFIIIKLKGQGISD